MKPLLLAMAFIAPLSALAQRNDEASNPWDEDEEAPARARQPQRPPRATSPVRPVEPPVPSSWSRGFHDDPNVGLAAEGLIGVALLASPRGALVDPQLMAGARLTWEFMRLASDERLRELLFADVTWFFTSASDGTNAVHASTVAHLFTVAPAIAWRFGDWPVAGYLQVGAGAKKQGRGR